MTKPYYYDQTVIDIFFNITVKKTHLKSDFISVLTKQHRGCYLDDAISKQTYSKVLIFVKLYLKVILL